MVTARALMVMPRSRSSSISSRIWSSMVRLSTLSVSSRMRPDRVLLPGSLWAMIHTLGLLARAMGCLQVVADEYDLAVLQVAPRHPAGDAADDLVVDGAGLFRHRVGGVGAGGRAGAEHQHLVAGLHARDISHVHD